MTNQLFAFNYLQTITNVICHIFARGLFSWDIFDNYRPIFLLPAISKVFEKIVFTQVYEYFEKNNLLYASQYGFRSLHSTELAALEMTDIISRTIN